MRFVHQTVSQKMLSSGKLSHGGLSYSRLSGRRFCRRDYPVGTAEAVTQAVVL